jgi:hypothetical protein
MLHKEKLNRRQLLIGASAGAVGIGAVALSPITALAAGSSGIVGTWDVRITDMSGPAPVTFEGVTTFAPGGGVVTMNSNSPSTGIGSWANTGGATFHARFMEFGFSPQGGSKAVVSVKGRQSDEGTIRGTFTLNVYDLMGHLLLSGGKGTFVGKRFAA